MTKVLLYGRMGSYPREAEPLFDKSIFQIVSDHPDVVVSLGGDGTLLGAERDYPGIPKLYLKDSSTCFHCSSLPNEKLVKLLADGQLQTEDFLKVELIYRDRQLTALNDLVIAHESPTHAIRFRVDDGPELIGDGLVFATPFGSTAYFYSITKKTFNTGIGLAYNNIHNLEAREQILPENSVTAVEIVRGPVVVSCDNDPDLLRLSDGTKITVGRSPACAKLLYPKNPNPFSARQSSPTA